MNNERIIMNIKKDKEDLMIILSSVIGIEIRIKEQEMLIDIICSKNFYLTIRRLL